MYAYNSRVEVLRRLTTTGIVVLPPPHGVGKCFKPKDVSSLALAVLEMKAK